MFVIFPEIEPEIFLIFLNFYSKKLARMVYTFVVDIVYLNLNSIFNILNAITT